MEFKGFNNGFFSPLQEIKIPVENVTLGRGYGVYEFFRIHHGRPFYLDRHLNRFYQSLDLLKIEIVFNPNDFERIIDQLIALTDLPDFFIKVYAIPGSLEKLSPAAVYIIPVIMQEYAKEVYQTGSNLLLREYIRFLPEAKSTNYIASVFWKPEMDAMKAIDVLFVNKGMVLESSRGNIFVVKNRKIYTSNENILKGITRSIVIDIMTDFKIQYSTGNFNTDFLFEADEVFITSTTKLIMPIVRIEDRIIADGKPGERTKEILTRYIEIMDKG